MRQPLRRFANAMEEVLKLNDHKGKRGWQDSQTSWLIKQVFKEAGELVHAYHNLANGKPNMTKEVEALRRECCDIANFAMMIFDNSFEEEEEITP